MIELLKSKIHRATVSQSDINYEGSITIYKELMDKAQILEYEKVSMDWCQQVSKEINDERNKE